MEAETTSKNAAAADLSCCLRGVMSTNHTFYVNQRVITSILKYICYYIFHNILCISYVSLLGRTELLIHTYLHSKSFTSQAKRIDCHLSQPRQIVECEGSKANSYISSQICYSRKCIRNTFVVIGESYVQYIVFSNVS